MSRRSSRRTARRNTEQVSKARRREADWHLARISGNVGVGRLCPTPRKLAFDTEDAAQTFIDSSAAAPRLFGVPLNPYQCPGCGRWHTTTQPRGPEGQKRVTL